MQRMQCELCGSIDIIKVEQDCFQCQHCGCKYTLAQAKMLISGTVEVVKGQAELERQLKNADAQIRYGAYDDAGKIYAALAEEYPDQHIVWQKTMDCRRAALLSGYRVLDGGQAMQMYQIYRRLCISAESEQERSACERDDELFWKELCMKHAAGQVKMEEISVFRSVYANREKGVMPKDCIAAPLWDYLVLFLTRKIRNREFQLMTKTFSESDEHALLKYGLNNAENYPAIMLLEDMHPKFAEMIETGRAYAEQINKEAVRMGFMYARGPIWLRAGMEELNGLYIHVTFALQGHIFGDYTTYSSGIRPEKKIHHKNADVSTWYANLRSSETPQQSFLMWNKRLQTCPFCGSPLQDSWFGRKCSSCGRKVPRM